MVAPVGTRTSLPAARTDDEIERALNASRPAAAAGPAAAPVTAAKPAAAKPAAAAAPSLGETDEYTVVKGDSMWKIAERLKASTPELQGAPTQKVIDLLLQAEENKHLTEGPKRKADGGMIFPGDKVKLPKLAAPAPAPAPAPQAPPTVPPGTPAGEAWSPRAAAAAPAIAPNAAAPAPPLLAQFESAYPMYKAELEKPVDANYLSRVARVQAALAEFETKANGLPTEHDPKQNPVNTDKFQSLVTMIDRVLEKVEASEAQMGALTKKLQASAAKPEGLSAEEGKAALEEMKALAPYIRDPDAASAPLEPLLLKAGVIQPKPTPAAVATPPDAGPQISEAQAAHINSQIAAKAYSEQLMAALTAARAAAQNGDPARANQILKAITESEEFKAKGGPAQ